MTKESPSFFRIWQRRYFVLAHRKLKYYKSRSDYKVKNTPKGVINFESFERKQIDSNTNSSTSS